MYIYIHTHINFYIYIYKYMHYAVRFISIANKYTIHYTLLYIIHYYALYLTQYSTLYYTIHYTIHYTILYIILHHSTLHHSKFYCIEQYSPVISFLFGLCTNFRQSSCMTNDRHFLRKLAFFPLSFPIFTGY